MCWRVAFAALLASGCVLRADAPQDRADAMAPIDASPPIDAAPPPDAAASADADCAGSAPTEGPVLTALRAAPLEIVVDGALDEPAWSFAHRVELQHPTISDNSVTAYVLWDEAVLLLAFDVVDAQLEAVDLELHLDDGVELYLDSAHDESEALDADDVHVIATINQMWSGGDLVTKQGATGAGYVIELGIPWATIGGEAQPGRVMGLLLGNNDRDLDVSVQFDWLGLIDSGDYDRPNLWGDLVLADELAGAGCR